MHTGQPAAIRTAHNAEESRYELMLGEEVVGFAEYRLDGAGTVANFHHTLIEPSHRGQGLASCLVTAALDDMRSRGRRVTATCWYVQQFLVEHPAYADLRA